MDKKSIAACIVSLIIGAVAGAAGSKFAPASMAEAVCAKEAPAEKPAPPKEEAPQEPISKVEAPAAPAPAEKPAAPAAPAK